MHNESTPAKQPAMSGAGLGVFTTRPKCVGTPVGEEVGLVGAYVGWPVGCPEG